jgi:hypothetical protein
MGASSRISNMSNSSFRKTGMQRTVDAPAIEPSENAPRTIMNVLSSPFIERNHNKVLNI